MVLTITSFCRLRFFLIQYFTCSLSNILSYGRQHWSVLQLDSSKTLTWNARVRVALRTARALECFHEVSLPSVIHRNLKSTNILLDEELNPHLSDCGLAAALTPNTERELVGLFDYIAHELALSGIYTVKSDVYSFGAVMLELLTGRKLLESSRPPSEQSLVRWATPQLHDIDSLAKMVDHTLINDSLNEHLMFQDCSSWSYRWSRSNF
ncbi:putative protein kinase RLK-Pelle-LRR-V family [Helianthus anomalus]